MYFFLTIIMTSSCFSIKQRKYLFSCAVEKKECYDKMRKGRELGKMEGRKSKAEWVRRTNLE